LNHSSISRFYLGLGLDPIPQWIGHHKSLASTHSITYTRPKYIELGPPKGILVIDLDCSVIFSQLSKEIVVLIWILDPKTLTNHCKG